MFIWETRQPFWVRSYYAPDGVQVKWDENIFRVNAYLTRMDIFTDFEL